MSYRTNWNSLVFQRLLRGWSTFNNRSSLFFWINWCYAFVAFLPRRVIYLLASRTLQSKTPSLQSTTLPHFGHIWWHTVILSIVSSHLTHFKILLRILYMYCTLYFDRHSYPNAIPILLLFYTLGMIQYYSSFSIFSTMGSKILTQSIIVLSLTPDAIENSL